MHSISKLDTVVQRYTGNVLRSIVCAGNTCRSYMLSLYCQTKERKF